jgi:hypothetical protein
MAEMATVQSAAVYNQVYPLQKAEYSSAVTEESNKAFVLVLLTSSQGMNPESQVMIEIWRDLAARFGDVKFCQMRGDLCIEGYPDRNTPTVLVYRNGDIQTQIVTLLQMKGTKTKAQDVEKVLVSVGAVQLNDRRLTKKEEESDDEERKTIRTGKTMAAYGDEEWE